MENDIKFKIEQKKQELRELKEKQRKNEKQAREINKTIKIDWARRKALQYETFTALYPKNLELFNEFFELLQAGRIRNMKEFAEMKGLKKKEERKFDIFNLHLFL